MRPHLEYLSYVLRHKWFVFRAGLKTGAPLWRLIIHDWTKFTPAEWGPYVNKFYRKPDRDCAQPDEWNLAFTRAWTHHWHRNPHHWEHWLVIADGTRFRAIEMPAPLVCEMVADWMGAGRAITGRWDIVEWYEKNKAMMILAPETRELVERLIGPF